MHQYLLSSDMPSLRIDFLPNRNTVIHESAFRDIVLAVFFSDHPYDYMRIRMEGSDRMHNGPRGVWRQYYTIDERNIAGSALEIIQPIIESDHELIGELLDDQYFLELTYRDDDFQHIQFPNVNTLTVSYKVDLHTAQCALTEQQVCSNLINDDSIIVIGDMDTYNQILGNA